MRARVAAKKDANQDEIVNQLRKIPGISVKVVHQLPGFCDIVVGFRRQNFLIEIKLPGPPHKQKLTKEEQAFKDGWRGQYDVATTTNQVLRIIGFIKKAPEGA